MHRLYGNNIKDGFYSHPDTSVTSQVCDTTTFRITYKGNIGSWILDTKSLPGGQSISAGQNNTGGNYNGWLFKAGRFGNILWTKEYGTNLNDDFKKVFLTADNGYLAIGSIQNTGPTPNVASGYAWVVKTDAQGNVQWSYKLNINPSDMQEACQTKDGGYALVASINLTGSATYIVVIKLNADGTLQWMKEYSNGSTAYGYYIKQSLDGNLLVAGFVYAMGAGLHDGILMKVSGSDGTLMWLKTYGSPADDVIDCFDQDAQGNLYLSLLWGITNQVSILKTDSDGKLLWAKLYSTSLPSSRGNVLKLTSSNNIILSLLNADRHYGGAVMQVSDSGNFEWAYDYHPSGSDIYSQYALDELSSHNGFLIGGTANIGSPTDFEGYLAKTDVNGKAGTCEIKPVQVAVSNLTPVVQDHQWDFISSPSDWVPIQVFTKTDTITQHYICPQCCISTDTIIDTAICQGETYTLPNDSVVSQSGTYPVKFTSSTGCDSIININLIINPAYHQTVYDSICPHEAYTLPDGTIVDSAGDYTSSLLTKTGCDSTVITHLSYRSPLFIQYNDSICAGTTLTLPNSKQVSQAGAYTVLLPSTTGCDTSAVYNIFMKTSPIIHLSGDTCLISGQTLLLNPGSGYPQYQWQDGSTQPTLTVFSPGLYWVKVSNECGSSEDTAKVTMNCQPRIFIPSAFTPNGDGMNDIFRILNVHGQKLIMFNVYNRWGKLVFHTTNISRGWDGTLDGEPATAGGYVYLVKIINLAGELKIYKGSVLLIR